MNKRDQWKNYESDLPIGPVVLLILSVAVFIVCFFNEQQTH